MSNLDVSTLALTLGFEIIPNTPEVTAAGYTDADRAQAQIWLGMGEDKRNFYYSAWAGDLLAGTALPSILVARRKCDGTLVYAVNTLGWSLDTAPTFIGPLNTVCRVTPKVYKDYIFLTTGQITNIGPQLFCINKHTGQLIWAIAYAPPLAVKEALGVDYITTRGDYSQFAGSNVALGDLNPNVVETSGGFLVLVGVASLQNAINPGLIPSNPNYIGYPFYTDQGGLYAVSTRNGVPLVKWMTPTCAPEVRVGEPVDAKFYLPGQTSTLIATLTPPGQPILTPAIAVPDFDYVFQRIDAESGVPVTPADLAPFWANVGSSIAIHLDGPRMNLTAALVAINATPGTYYLRTNYADPSVIQNTLARGAYGVFYFKRLSGGTVLNKYDANGLTYWGNSVWGQEAWIDTKRCLILFGSGQAHSAPVAERLEFLDPARNYRKLKVPLIDQISAYLDQPSANGLNALNQAKIDFMVRIRELSLAPNRSPVGQASYSDGIFGVSPANGRKLFAFRTVEFDVYSFLGEVDDLQQSVFMNDVDGDVGAGVVLTTRGLALAINKAGTAVSVDISHLTRVEFDDHNLEATGALVGDFVYASPNGALGGINLLSSTDGKKLYAIQANTSTAEFGGSVGSQGQFEEFVSFQGQHVPTFNSFASDFDGETINWIRPLNDVAFGAVEVKDGYVYTNTSHGLLYVLDTKDGSVEWQFNGKISQFPMHGGASRALVLKDKVIWINAYNVPIVDNGGGSRWGNVFEPDRCVKFFGEIEKLNGRTYVDVIPIIIGGGTTNTWEIQDGQLVVRVHQPGYRAIIPVKLCGSRVIFGIPRSQSGGRMLRYESAEFLNINTYVLTYYDVNNCRIRTAYMNSI